MKFEARKSGLNMIRGWAIFEWNYASYQLYECSMCKAVNVILIFSKSSWPKSEDQVWQRRCYFLKNNWISVKWKAPQIDREPKTGFLECREKIQKTFYVLTDNVICRSMLNSYSIYFEKGYCYRLVVIASAVNECYGTHVANDNSTFVSRPMFRLKNNTGYAVRSMLCCFYKFG